MKTLTFMTIPKLLFASFFLILLSCQPEEVQPNPPATPTPTPTPTPAPIAYFISYELDGVTISETNGVNEFAVSVSNGGSINGTNSTITVDLGSGLYFWDFANGNDVSSSISFDDNLFTQNAYNSDKAAALESIFTLGTHPYVSLTSTTPGIQINYSQANGPSWSSIEATQGAGATFTVTETTAATNGSGNPIRLVKGNFSGVLLGDGLGNTKTVNNGTFDLYFEAY